VSHAALPNIVLGREVVPEFLGWRRATPAALAAAAARLLNVGRTRQMLLCSTQQGFYKRWMTWRAVSARSETGVLTMAAVASGRWRPTTRSDPLYLKKLRGRSRETYVVEF
jgi:hypothetical protein